MLKEAAEEFEKALQINPDDKNARTYLQVTQSKVTKSLNACNNMSKR